MAYYILQYDPATGLRFAGQVTTGQIGSGAVGSGALGSGAVNSGNIASGQVGFPVLGNAVIASAQLASGIIAFPFFASGAVVSGAIGPGAVVSANIGSGQVGGVHVAAGAAGILSANYAANSLAAAHVANQGLTSSVYASGSLGGFHFAVAGVLSAHVASGALAGQHIAAGAVLSANYGLGSIGGAHIANQGLTSSDYATGSVGRQHLAVAQGPTWVFSGDPLGSPLIGVFLGNNDQAVRMYAQAGTVRHKGILQDVANSGQRWEWFTDTNANASVDWVWRTNISGTGTADLWCWASGWVSGSLKIGARSLDLFSGILSASIASGLAHHVESLVTSTDSAGIWSAAWKGAFGTSPGVTATPFALSGVPKFATIYNVTTALVNGQTFVSGSVPGASGVVHVMAHDPTM